MSNVAKLKKQAADLEGKKQFDKALAKYVEVVQAMEAADEDADVALYNRVGDLFARQNNIAEAVNYYEKAVDAYTETGLFNNAIALCNKILRVSPGRTSIYYKLGRISAHKGFKGDAKQNFLEYADRMQKAGQIDEAFRALREFADLCPDEDGIRLMLAEQLQKHGRKTEALEQLEVLYHHLDGEGRGDEAAAALERMKTIDPSYEPKAPSDDKKRKTKGLVFLDVEEPKRQTGSHPAARSSSSAATRASRALDSLPLIDTGEAPEPPKKAPAPAPKAAPSAPKAAPPAAKAAPPKAAPPAPAAPEPEEAAAASSDSLEGLSYGAGVDTGAAAPSGSGLEGLDTAFGFDSFAPTAPPADRTDAAAADAGVEEPSADLAFIDTSEPAAEVEPVADAASAMNEFSIIHEEPTDLLGSDLSSMETPSGDGVAGDLELILPDGPPLTRRNSVEMLRDMIPPLLRDEDPVEPALDVSGLEVTPSTREFPAPTPDAAATSALPMFDVDVSLDEPAEDHQGLNAAAMMTGEYVASDEEAADAGGRSTSSTLAVSVDSLRDRIAAEPENWELHRLLGEALLEASDREGALQELETAMMGYEGTDDLASASSVADELVRLDPESIRLLQKRVEYAFRTNDRPRLVEAYLGLADGLVRVGQADKSRAVYQRVLDLAPDDLHAQAGLEALGPEVEEAPPPPPKEKTGVGRRYTAEVRRTSIATPPPRAPSPRAEQPDDSFVNLGDWLRDDDGPKDTRMRVEEQEPTGDEEADFADMLRKFKQGVAENVEQEDHESHYDLGVAYKEMGLLDEAISEFQIALRGTQHRVRTFEALGNCFIEKGQYQIALTVLSRALAENVADDQLVGVLYLLGYSNEALQKYPEALEYYNRVFSVDIQFRDVGERIMAVEQVAQ